MVTMGQRILVDVQAGKEDPTDSQVKVHNIEIKINSKSKTATLLSEDSSNKNNFDPSGTTTQENVAPNQFTYTFNNQLIFKSNEPFPLMLNDYNNNRVAVQPLRSDFNVNGKRPSEPNVEPELKKVKCSDNVISPIRWISKKDLRKRNIRRIMPSRYKNDAGPNYVFSFILKHWPGVEICNPHNNLTKRFLMQGRYFDSFSFPNDSINYNCAAPYEQVLQVLAMEKFALHSMYFIRQPSCPRKQYNEALNRLQYLDKEEMKVRKAMEDSVILYNYFQSTIYKYNARIINHSRFAEATSIYPIIRSYENFYGHS